ALYCCSVHDYGLFKPLSLTLPREFKIAFEGCPLDCAQGPVNDIGAYAKVRDGRHGFSLIAGGGLGSQPFLAKPLVEFIPAEDLLIWCEAVVRVQHRYGERKNRHKARMKYVVQKMGVERFRATVLAEVQRVEAEHGPSLRDEVRAMVADYRLPQPNAEAPPRVAERDGYTRWRRTNTHLEKRAGHRSVVVQLALGDITSEQMRGVAALARRYGNGTVRCTNDQNMVLPSIAEAALTAVHA